MAKLAAKASVASSQPEVDLLLCCTRTCVDAESAERIRTLLREDIDWVYLSGIALLHGTTPLLYRSLHTTCPEAVPKAILDPLQDHFHTNASRNVFLAGELLKLLSLLEAHRIPAIPYKGPVLAASAYGDLTLRQFYDLDILVHKRDILTAKELFIAQGYWPSLQMTSAQEAAYLQSHHDYKLVRGDDAVVVELQWEVTQAFFSFPLDFDHLWERREQVTLAGTTVLNLAPEDLLLVLCVHGSKHLWRRLGWICDVAELIRARPRMNWRRVLEQAHALGGKRMLLLGLALANDLLGAVLPEAILQSIRADHSVTALAAWVKGRLFPPVGDPSGLLEERPALDLQDESPVLYFRMRERWRDQVAVCVHYGPDYLHRVITPNKRDWALLSLPSWLSGLYYLLRPLRLIGAYGRDVGTTLSSMWIDRGSPLKEYPSPTTPGEGA